MNLYTSIKKPSLTNRKHLSDIRLETHWPVLSLEPLSLTELEQDEYYSLIPKEQFPTYIEGAIQFGQEMAQKYGKGLDLKGLINVMLQHGVQVQFKDKHPHGESVRAQYSIKPPVIEIYRSSMQQIQQFFSNMKETIYEEDCWLIHLYHEWFHHLEETTCGYTYKHLPKIKMKYWGPFTIQKPIRRTREIAAHAFTQTIMNLKWSPLLLDHLMLYQARGWSVTQIREHFQHIKQQWEQRTKPTPPPDETESDPS